MARYQLTRETDPISGRETGWGVLDIEGATAVVLTDETYTIASQLCDSLNGFYTNITREIDEVAASILNRGRHVA